MAKNSWNDYSSTNASNSDIQSIDISEGCSPSNINNAIRELMVDTANVVSGSIALSSINIDGGAIDGTAIGANSASTGAFTTLSTSSNVSVTGNITVSGTVDGRDVATDGSKLDGIESGATADQSAAEILTAIKTVDGAGSGLDADLLDGISSASFLRSDADDTSTGTITSNPASGANILFQNGSGAAVGRVTFDGSNLKVRGDSSKGLILGANNTDVLTIDTSSNASFTGNINVGGTVDGRDVASDGSKLDGIEAGATADQSASEILTAIKTVDGSGSGLDADLLDGISSASFLRSDAADAKNSGDLTFSDNVSLKLGSDSDLQLYHNGSASYIIEAGTGNLFIGGNTDVKITNAAATENKAVFTTDGAVELYFDNSKKIETVSGGVSISGNLDVSNGLDVTGAMYASGNIGLDTTDFISFTNNTRMDVTINGSNEFRFESDGDFHADGDVIAFSTTVASDERLKENISDIENALEKVKQINGVTFNYKEDKRPSAGVIAQQIENVLPVAVSEKELPFIRDDGQKYKVVNYDALHGLLIEAIKELSAEIEELKRGSAK